MLSFPKKIVLVLGLLWQTLSGSAQVFYESTEYGFLGGAATYFGDLNPNYGLKFIRPAAGAFVRYHFNPYISLRGAANYTQVGYDDKFSTNEFQQIRNLNFKSNILEASLMAEFNFFWFSTGDPKHRFTPYLALGVGAFYYEPYTRLNDQRQNLRPLGTEGQNHAEFSDRKYNPYSICLPVGAGIKYWIGPGVNFGLELINRFTFTDYIDDVSTTYVGLDRFTNNPNNLTAAAQLQDRSIPGVEGKLGTAGKQRGDAASKDQYFMIQCSLSFQLKTYKCPPNQRGWSAE